MKSTKKLAALLLAVLVIFSFAGISASAATTAQDGFTVTLTTDRTEYSEGNQIVATLTAKNTNDVPVANVRMETSIPNGFKLASNSTNVKDVEMIQPGLTESLVVTYVRDGVRSPQTGVISDYTVLFAVLALSAAAVVVLLKTKKSKRATAMLLALAIVCGAFATLALSASAAEVSVNETVNYAGSDVTITGTVTGGELVTNGQITGSVLKDADNAPVAGATIKVFKGNEEVATLTTNEEGLYDTTLGHGDYRLEVTFEDYIPVTYYVNLQGGEHKYLQTVLLIQGDPNAVCTVSGTIKDAVTGEGLEGVALTVRKGWGAPATVETVTTLTSASNGTYSVELPLGYYTITAEKEGYITDSFNVIASEGTRGNQDGTLSPELSGDNFRIVLTWGSDPRDLDSHVVGTKSNGNSYHVYFGNRNAYDGDTNICNLDVDDTSSYGPETITLVASGDAPYYYYVKKYAGNGELTTSAAKVSVYQGNQLVRTFEVPQVNSTDRYWNVFAIVNGDIVVNNSITENPDTAYIL